ncbi:ATP-dependent DNA helicase [Bullifex porci]|nr:ATP-dependent DNA helicase [Bullifex porci]
MIDPLKIDDILGAGGALSNYFTSYEERGDQIEMSKLVLEGYEKNMAEVIEAGTGIGKSFGYLVPAILHYKETGEKTVVATSTITLQKQLVDKDLPTLANALSLDIPYALVMGRANYLCLRRYYDNSVSASIFLNDIESSESKLLSWVRSTEEGVLDELESLPKGVLKSDIASDYELCLGSKCPYYNKCFFYKSRRKADGAGIIITNHHLLFLDAKKRDENDEDYSEKALLPPYNRLIIDECHNMDKNATSLFTKVLSYSSFLWEFRKLVGVKHGANANNLITLAAGHSKGTEEKAIEVIKELESCEKLFNHFNSTLVLSLNGSEQRVDRGNYALFLKKYQDSLIAIKHSLDLISATLNYIISKSAFSDEDAYIQQGITSSICTFEGFSSFILEFLNVKEFKDKVYYLVREKTRNREEVGLRISPLEVNDILRESIFDKLGTVICLSATLKVDREFDFFRHQVGLDDREILSGCYESPFDYRRNLLLLIDNGKVIYKNDQEEEYFEHATNKIVTAIKASGGGALVLFTSYKMLSYVSSRALSELDGMNILIQNGELSRSQLLNRFREDKDSVLFATQSFWEGVDIPGDSLRLLILTKLPYPQVNEPLFKSRCEKIDSEGQSSYMLLSVPSMIMKLKQGLGRLIRSKDDKGVAFILDGRINRNRDYILSQLPACNCPEDFIDESLERRIEDFLY